MKNKNLLIIIAIVAVLIIGGLGYYFVAGKKTATQNTANTNVDEEEKVETIAPADLGLSFTARADKKAVKFVIDKADGIENVEYQISYTKKVEGEQVPEGLIGEAKPQSGKVAIDYRELGTCSAKVCRYDVVVSDIKLTLKVLKGGKTYQSETSLSL
jgi:hypothetical protein